MKLRLLLLALVSSFATADVVFPPSGTGGAVGGTAHCVDATAPSMASFDPSGAGSLPGTSYTLEVDATDDVAIQQVCFWYVYCGASSCSDAFSTATLIGCDTTATGDTYSILWTYPNCIVSPDNTHNVWFQAIDTCGNSTEYLQDDQVLGNRGC